MGDTMFENKTLSNNISSDIYEEMGPRIDTAYTVLVGVILSPIILIGIVGNIFSLLVWIKGRRRKTSTARYLSALALADILVLVTSALDFWIVYVLHIDLRASSRFLCKFFYFITFFGPSVSAWILVFVTVERTLSVWIPHRIGIVCRPLTAYLVTGLAAVVIFFAYLPFMIGVDVVTVYNTVTLVAWKSCQALQNYSFFKYALAWFWMDMIVYFIIPFSLILVCNSAILIRICQLEKKKRKNLKARGVRNNGAQTKSQQMMSTVTVRIIALSFAFLICVAPLAILNVMLMVPWFAELVDLQHVDKFRIPFHCLMYLHHGINFVLYCFIGSGFRKDLVGIFRGVSSASVSR